MKQILAIVFCALFASISCAQTIKTLGYNTTNGRVIYGGTNKLTFTNSVGFAEGDVEITDGGAISWAGSVRYEPETQSFFSALNFSDASVASGTRTNMGLPFAALTNTNAANFRSAIDIPLAALTNTNAINFRTDIGLGATWLTNTDVTNFRTAVGLSLAALTNTSNVTIMRALGGSTNTNQPFSGIITYKDDVDDINTLTVSNGIIIQQN